MGIAEILGVIRVANVHGEGRTPLLRASLSTVELDGIRPILAAFLFGGRPFYKRLE